MRSATSTDKLWGIAEQDVADSMVVTSASDRRPMPPPPLAPIPGYQHFAMVSQSDIRTFSHHTWWHYTPPS